MGGKESATNRCWWMCRLCAKYYLSRMFLISPRTWLFEPFPFTNDWTKAFKSALGSALFVTFFLFVFKPFGTTVPPGAELKFLGVAALFGIVTAATVVLVNGLTLMLPSVFDEEKWVVWKEIFYNLFFVSLIGIGNMVLSHFSWNAPITFFAFLKWQGITFAVGIFPVVVGAFIGYSRLRDKYSSEAAHISPHPHTSNLPEQKDPVLLEGENQNERLTLQAEQVVYIASADNYVRIYYFEQEKLKNQLLRATMKKMEDAVAKHPALFRCHRTFIVNMDMVEKVSGNAQGFRLHLAGVEETIPVSRNLNDLVRNRLK